MLYTVYTQRDWVPVFPAIQCSLNTMSLHSHQGRGSGGTMWKGKIQAAATLVVRNRGQGQG